MKSNFQQVRKSDQFAAVIVDHVNIYRHENRSATCRATTGNTNCVQHAELLARSYIGVLVKTYKIVRN
jgi:hypothetical protein